MERWTVKSSTIRAIGYDQRRKTLQVEFKNGRAYHYLDIPREIYIAFVNAASHGAFFNRFIRNKYPGRKMP
jgi:1,2-phenylacetyl-CoA epoxidase PaaB subunit